MRLRILTIAAALLASLAVPAAAQQFARVTTDLNMRAGPGTQYPVINTIPGRNRVNVYGCLNSFAWCDVGWRGLRGWVSARYLAYHYRGRDQALSAWGWRADMPVISFNFGTYSDRHYRGRPVYNDVRRWDRRHDRRFDRRDHRNDRYEGRRDRRDDWRRGDARRDRDDWRRGDDRRRGDARRDRDRRDRDWARDDRRRPQRNYTNVPQSTCNANPENCGPDQRPLPPGGRYSSGR